MSQPTGDPTTATTVKPSDMPGAQPTGQAPQTPPAPTQQPEKPAATSTPQAPAPDAQKPNESQTATDGKLTDDERSELERLRAVRTEERIWEKRAKANKDKADKWEQYEESQKTEDQRRAEAEAAKDRRIAELETRDLRNTVSRDTGVPVDLIHGTTEEEMRAAAKAAQDWKGPAKPASSAVPADVVTSSDTVKGPEQIKSRGELASMTPAQILTAYREGRLKDLGAVPGQGDLKNMQHAKSAAAQRK